MGNGRLPSVAIKRAFLRNAKVWALAISTNRAFRRNGFEAELIFPIQEP